MNNPVTKELLILRENGDRREREAWRLSLNKQMWRRKQAGIHPGCNRTEDSCQELQEGVSGTGEIAQDKVGGVYPGLNHWVAVCPSDKAFTFSVCCCCSENQ